MVQFKMGVSPIAIFPMKHGRKGQIYGLATGCWLPKPPLLGQLEFPTLGVA